MTSLPADVRETLRDLLATAREQLREGETDAAKETVRRIAGVASEDVPGEELSAQLRHGCEAVEYHAAEDPTVAVEYLRSMRERVADESDSA